jgi:hypothetical protein
MFSDLPLFDQIERVHSTGNALHSPACFLPNIGLLLTNFYHSFSSRGEWLTFVGCLLMAISITISPIFLYFLFYALKHSSFLPGREGWLNP